jgi:hypothetical protein
MSLNTEAMNRCSAVAEVAVWVGGLAVAEGKAGNDLACASVTDVLVAEGDAEAGAEADVDADGEPPDELHPAASPMASNAMGAAVTTRRRRSMIQAYGRVSDRQ